MIFYRINIFIDFYGYKFVELYFNEQWRMQSKTTEGLANSESVFFLFSIKTSKCRGSCNYIKDPYANICVPDVVKNLNVKVFNLMLRTNETRHLE